MFDLTGHILWAEDNPYDRLLVQEAVGGLAPLPRVSLVHDGVLAVEALERGLPCHIVLDLKMPRLGGLEVLRLIRSRPDWSSIPVTIFNSGNRPEEIAACQALGVEGVVQKPVDFDTFTAAIQGIVRPKRP